MKNLFKKPLNYLLTGSFSVVFAACYGAPMDLENPKLIKATDDNNLPIQGLKVSVFENRLNIDEGYTNEEGSVQFYLLQKDKYNYKVTIEDVDGMENEGEFISKDVNITETGFIEVVLDRKE